MLARTKPLPHRIASPVANLLSTVQWKQERERAKMNNRVVKKEDSSAAAAASSQKKNSESNSCAKDDDGVVNNHHDEVTINNNSFNDAVVGVDDELLRKVMAEAMATLDNFFSTTTTSVLLPNTNTNTYVDVNVDVDVHGNNTAAATAAPTTVALPVVNNSDTLSTSTTTTTTTTVADIMAKSYNDSNGDDAVTVTTTNIAGHDDTKATKADDVGNNEGKTNNDNNNHNDRINEGIQKIKTEPRESVWVLYNGNNNNINSNSNSNNDDDYHKSQTVSQSRSAMKKDIENSKDDGTKIKMPPTKKRKSRLLRELEDHLGLPTPSSSSSDDDDDNDSDIQPPPPKIKMPPTNRKRTRDHSADDEESCDDTDDSNIDDDEEEEDPPRKDNNAVRNSQKDNRRSRKNEEIWMGMYEKLVAYKNQHKNTMVPQRYKKDPKLGQWVYTQRRKHKSDELDPNRVDLLESIGFDWDGLKCKAVTDQMIWMNMFEKLVEYKKEHKNTLVPHKYEKDPKLGLWVSRQRKAYKNDDLDPNRVDLLDSINFIWEVDYNQMWMGMFEKLVEYKEEHKNTLVPVYYEKDPKLGHWVRTQRKAYRNDKLLPKRLALLTTIDFTWNVYKAAR